MCMVTKQTKPSTMLFRLCSRKAFQEFPCFDFIELSEQEKHEIIWHMGFSDDNYKAGSQSVGKAFKKSQLAVITHIADILETYFNERG